MKTPHMKKRSPLKSIRAFCLSCEGGSPANVEQCLFLACPLREYRSGKALKNGKHDPLTAIANYCLEQCQAGSSRYEVEICQGDECVQGPCSLYPFRLGKNPNKSKPLSAERRIALVEAGKKHRFKTGCNPTFCSPESTETGKPIPKYGSHEINPINHNQKGSSNASPLEPKAETQSAI